MSAWRAPIGESPPQRSSSGPKRRLLPALATGLRASTVAPLKLQSAPWVPADGVCCGGARNAARTSCRKRAAARKASLAGPVVGVSRHAADTCETDVTGGAGRFSTPRRGGSAPRQVPPGRPAASASSYGAIRAAQGWCSAGKPSYSSAVGPHRTSGGRRQIGWFPRVLPPPGHSWECGGSRGTHPICWGRQGRQAPKHRFSAILEDLCGRRSEPRAANRTALEGAHPLAPRVGVGRNRREQSDRPGRPPSRCNPHPMPRKSTQIWKDVRSS